MPTPPYSAPRSRYLLMVRLPRAVEVRIEDRFLPSIGATRPAMGYHVSIVGPFYWAVDDQQAPLARLRHACAHARPLLLRIRGIDVFENAPDDCGVFLGVGPVRPLQALRQQLLVALGEAITPQYQRSGPFRPHVTIGLNLPSQVGRTLLQSGRAPFRAHFEAREIWLLEQRPQNPWRPLLAFGLGLAADGSTPAPRELGREETDG